MATDGPSTSASTSSSEKTETTKTAADLLAQGKRNLVCGEINQAVSLYEEATKMLVQSFGELSRDCADAYFQYGSALLELGRTETNVLSLGGTALGTTADDEEDEDKDDEEDNGVDKATQVDEIAADDEVDNDTEKTTHSQAPGEREADNKHTEENVEEEKEEEDVPSFQLAWEYLDLAKVIYLRSELADEQLKAAECYIKLGEISMETEQHETAAEDLESALKIQHKFLAADDRLLAESHYQLGLAYCLGKMFDLSVQHYTQAIEVLELKIASLRKLVEQAAGADNDARVEQQQPTAEIGQQQPTAEIGQQQSTAAVEQQQQKAEQVNKYQDEITELQELIPEMKLKIDDVKEEAKSMEHMKQMAQEALGFGSPSKKFTSSPVKTGTCAGDATASINLDENGKQKASDIAHLVRKKRKPENEAATAAADDQESKKLRCEDGTRNQEGSLQVNGSNSHQD